ncbi:M1 family metallopeptidase [Flammeovirga agarivorans]|uniref:Aminopeptidase N n=1 Tax=Flammeovirga agarivorans TaxID=2726742 RepID=A0A7X8SNV2_9BACT|nr:M1 family aminopeptidase [Flammeovirga agarivorans]NLR93673.1 hypothetical protein [Flammeovirga agarivorans]
MRKLLLLIFLSISIMGCKKELNLPQTNGVSLTLAQHRFENLSNIRYELHFVLPELKEEEIQATAYIEVDIKDADHPLLLDFATENNEITNLVVNNQQSDYRYKLEHIVIPSEKLTEGKNKISFHFTAGDQSLNRKENYMYTLLVPDRARTLFPCFDQPDLKATYLLSLDMPESWKAISAEYGKSTPSEDGRTLIVFGESQPMSTYLFSFVAGEFEEVVYNDGKQKFHMLHMESDEKINNNKKAIFDLHVNSIKWLEEYTGIPYPYHKLDFALIPPFQYGGMEHVGAIQYRASSLILDENAGPSEHLRRAQLIAHEVAHTWFGNLVTMKWFNDVWLKEVFANFIAAKAVEPNYPEINHDLQFYLSHQNRAYVVDRTAGSHPIQQQLDNLNLAGTLYGAIIYSKAPVVMAQLEKVVGPENMQKALQSYLSKYAFSNATFDQLIAEISTASGLELKEWADSWVKKEGMPLLQFSSQEDLLSIQYSVPNASQIIEVNKEDILLDQQKIQLNSKINGFPLDQSAKGYGYFELDEVLQEQVINSINTLSDTEAVVAYGTLFENFLHQKVDIEVYVQFLIEQIKVEDNLLLKNMLSSQLNEVYWYYLNDKERIVITNNEFDTFKKLMESVSKKEIKAFYFNILKLFAHTEKHQSFFSSYLTKKNTSPKLNDRNRIALLQKLRLEQLVTDEELVVCQSLIEASYYQDFLKYILPSSSQQQDQLDQFIEDMKKVENRGNEPWVEQALGYINHPLQAKLSLKHIPTILELLPEVQKTGDIFFPYNYLRSSIGKRTEKEVVKITNDYIQQHPEIDSKLKAKILQNLDPVIRRSK